MYIFMFIPESGIGTIFSQVCKLLKSFNSFLAVCYFGRCGHLMHCVKAIKMFHRLVHILFCSLC